MNPNYKEKNAIKNLYDGIYELDKSFNFKYPKLKPDLEKYLKEVNRLLVEAFDTAQINRIKGHELKVQDDKND